MITLTRIRLAHGMSKAKLARRAELDQSRLSKIESGRDRPYERELARLASALGFPPEHMQELLAPTSVDDQSFGATQASPHDGGKSGVAL